MRIFRLGALLHGPENPGLESSAGASKGFSRPAFGYVLEDIIETLPSGPGTRARFDL
jgi:hypothetical protein